MRGKRLSNSSKEQAMTGKPLHHRIFTFAALIAILAAPLLARAAEPTMVVYKTPNCGCCVKWIEHLREAGLKVEAKNARNLDALREELGVPRKLAGCHTATLGNYLVEGHVPAAQILRLLKDEPAIAGISVPGMPVGSPGMEGPGGMPYSVLSWRRDGAIEVISIEQPRER
jgi:hypothetical protein